MGDEKHEIAAFYARGLERDRLSAGQGALELLRTQQLLERYLPAAPAVLADVGGGPGRYALWLARQRYRVHLVDPVTLHVEQARSASQTSSTEVLASAQVGDARELPFPDASMDAVLLLGPLYHLSERADRLQALAEARRVCRRAWRGRGLRFRSIHMNRAGAASRGTCWSKWKSWPTETLAR